MDKVTEARLRLIKRKRGERVASIIAKIESLNSSDIETLFFDGATDGYEETAIYDNGRSLKVTIEFDKGNGWMMTEKIFQLIEEQDCDGKQRQADGN